MSQETKNAQHTPGPWEKCEFEVMREVKPGLVMAVPIYTRRIEGTLSPVSDDWDEAMANARLIAAAPELLSVCKDLDAAWDDFMMVDENDNNVGTIDGVCALLPRLRAAIAKAEGR